MYQTIVVPLDSSERAETILPHVEELAGIKMGKVILLHVIEPTTFASSPAVAQTGATPVTPQACAEQVEAMREAGKEYLSRIQSNLKAKGIDAEAVIETGPAAERIVHVAEKRDADLIAIASHGRTGLARVFFGSVAAAVLHRSETPLLLVRSGTEGEV
jgi:nucleotide-binding universal stress UspA family protein